MLLVLLLRLLVMLLRLLVMLLVLQKLHELLLLLLLQESQGLGIELSTLLHVLEIIGLRLLEGRIWGELERHLRLRSTLAELWLLIVRVLRVLGLLLCVLRIRGEGLGHPVWLLGLLVHWLAVGSSGLRLRLGLGLVD